MKKTLYNIVTTSKRAALIVIVIVISIFLLYSSYVYKNLNIEVITLLKESTNKTAAILENKINSHQHSVQDLALSISDENVMSDKNIQLLKKIIENYNYLRMGVVDKNLKAVTTDGKIVQLTESEYLNKAFNGSVSVSEQIFDVVDGNPIIVYAAPVFTSDYSSVQAILFATFSISEYHDTLSSHVFDSQGCSYILKNNGAIITSNCYLMSPESSNNLFHYIKKIHGDNANDIKCMENKIIKGNEGYIKVKDKISSSSFVEKYYYFTPLGFNDWVYVTSVPVTILHKEMTLTLLSTLILACIIIVITISILSILLNNQKKSKVALEDMIYKNKITGNLSYEKFKMEAIQLLRKKEYNYALVVIDIEKFKYINDMFGYTEGDNLIRFIDSVLLNNCHKNELTSHILGDDFIMLLRTTDRESLCRRLEKTNEEIEQYVRPKNRYYKISLLMGVYEILNGEYDIDAMRDRAEIPLNNLKNNKIALYLFYDEEMRKKIVFERELENRMQEALEINEFIVYYQPKYSTSDGSLCGGEALIRWIQKDGKILPPAIFIPLFEENGFIVQLDKFVFEQICRDVTQWKEKGYQVVPISCNISRKSVVVDNLVEEYEAIIQRYDVDTSLVAIELIESAFIENDFVIREFVEKFNEKNIKIIMDDFGVGFSSIGLIKEIDIAALKIDRSFVLDINENYKSKLIVEAIIKLMKRLNIKVNAEGIETLEQAESLTQLGCDEIQGYYYDKPLTKEDFEKRMISKAKKQS